MWSTVIVRVLLAAWLIGIVTHAPSLKSLVRFAVWPPTVIVWPPVRVPVYGVELLRLPLYAELKSSSTSTSLSS